MVNGKTVRMDLISCGQTAQAHLVVCHQVVGVELAAVC